MISETKFAQSYGSFWRSVTENSEDIIKKINITTKRYDLAIAERSSSSRHSYIGEMAFRIFAKLYPNDVPNLDNASAVVSEVALETSVFLRRFEGVTLEQVSDPTQEELAEILLLSKSLFYFVSCVSKEDSTLVVNPSFKGCGIVDSCFGDLLIDDVLIEVKSGDRTFRSADIRQLLIYCALSMAKGIGNISKVSCVNPRRGTYFILGLNELCMQLGNKPATELLSELIYFMSSSGISV